MAKTNKPLTPFRITCDVTGILDIMTALYHLIDTNKLVPNTSSKFFTRFPSFSGEDWDFGSIKFQEVLDKAVYKHNLFSKVRPYRFSHRDLTHLRLRGAEINVLIPSDYSNYSTEIADVISRLFPSQQGLKDVVIFKAQDINWENHKTNIWVVRSVVLAETLIKKHQPLVLVDGKENRHIDNAIRLTGWNLIGDCIRHAQEIYLHSQNPDHQSRLVGIALDPIEPHKDVWFGHQFIPGDPLVELSWVRRMLETINSSSSEGSTYFRYSDGRAFNESQRLTAYDALFDDQHDLHHKIALLKKLNDERFDITMSTPRWYNEISAQQSRLTTSLIQTQDLLKSHPVTGETKKDLISALGLELNYTSNWTGSDFLSLVARNLDFFSSLELKGNLSDNDNLRGQICESAATIILKEQGWYPLETVPIDRTRVPSNFSHCAISPSSSNGFIAQWQDIQGQKYFCELDVVAYDPQDLLHSVEVKSSRSQEPSPTQKRFIHHVKDGGEIFILNSKELDPTIPITITPKFMIIDYQTISHNIPRDPIRSNQRSTARETRQKHTGHHLEINVDKAPNPSLLR